MKPTFLIKIIKDFFVEKNKPSNFQLKTPLKWGKSINLFIISLFTFGFVFGPITWGIYPCAWRLIRPAAFSAFGGILRAPRHLAPSAPDSLLGLCLDQWAPRIHLWVCFWTNGRPACFLDQWAPWIQFWVCFWTNGRPVFALGFVFGPTGAQDPQED